MEVGKTDTYSSTIADKMLVWLKANTDVNEWHPDVIQETREALMQIVDGMLKPSDLEVLFQKIIDYANAKRDWDDNKLTETGQLQRYMRLVNVEAWLKAFADGILGKEA